MRVAWVWCPAGYVAGFGVPTARLAYVSDCVLLVNSDALLSINGLKNIIAFGFLHGIVSWIDEVGHVDCFGTMAGILVAILGIGAALLFVYSAMARHVWAQWRVILVQVATLNKQP